MQTHKELLIDLATTAMQEHNLRTTFSPEALAILDQIGLLPVTAMVAGHPQIRDLRALPWCSIDNDDSLDLDQLSAAEKLSSGHTRIWVAIADVTDFVMPGTALDDDAYANAFSVYTPAIIFPMLPERLSTGLTSLNPNEDRLAMVVEMEIDREGALQNADIYRAAVRNKAKLAYNSLAAWLDDEAELPEAAARVEGLDETLRLQDRAGERMSRFRQSHGALSLETIEGRPVFEGARLRGVDFERKNRATRMIENFMIAANGATARFLAAHGFPSIRRVVLAPKRWDRICELAETYGAHLPPSPDSIALEKFLQAQKARDELRFPDLSLAVVKLLGDGGYVAEAPNDPIPDYFSLAARDYSHSTARNRRYPEIVTQRLLKAALAGRPSPYSLAELTAIAEHCTLQEDEISKVERQANKSAVALLLSGQIGQRHEGLVTGASPKGTWVRLLDIPVEGRLTSGFAGLDVGDRVRVELDSVNVDRGFIDFRRRK